MVGRMFIIQHIIYIYISFFVFLFFCLACIWVQNCILVVSSWWVDCLLIVDSTWGTIWHRSTWRKSHQSISKEGVMLQKSKTTGCQTQERLWEFSLFRLKHRKQTSYHEKYPNRCSKNWQRFPESFSWGKVCTKKCWNKHLKLGWMPAVVWQQGGEKI